jgi:outer membrane lipoprotein-sorting protein
MTVKTCMICAAAVVLACLASGQAYAAYDQASGELKSVDAAAGKIVVAVRAGRDAEPKETTFLVDKDTTIRINREKKALADLAVGKRVSVVFKEAAKDGDPATALLISVMERPAGGRGGAGGGGRGGAGGGQ